MQGQVRSRCAPDPSCQATCMNGFLQIPCPAICVIGGCECPTGTVIDEDSNMCVPPDGCPTSMIHI